MLSMLQSLLLRLLLDPRDKTLEIRERVPEEGLPLVEEDLIRGHRGKLNAHIFVGFNRMYSGALRELEQVIVNPLSIIFERSWRTREVPEDYKKASVTSVFKNDKKEDLGNERPVSLTSVLGR